MTKQKDTDNELDKDRPNNPVDFDLDRSQVIRDIMDFNNCSEADAEEFWEKFLDTARKRKDK